MITSYAFHPFPSAVAALTTSVVPSALCHVNPLSSRAGLKSSVLRVAKLAAGLAEKPLKITLLRAKVELDEIRDSLSKVTAYFQYPFTCIWRVDVSTTYMLAQRL